LIPQKGVYIVQSILNKKTVNGIMNIGVNPTVGGETISVEVYFLDFNADLYNQEIQVSLLDYLRPEQKFDSVSLLKEQLEKDRNTAIAFFKTL
jgi:riboflavin kinase/FMN adenylyltransferase